MSEPVDTTAETVENPTPRNRAEKRAAKRAASSDSVPKGDRKPKGRYAELIAANERLSAQIIDMGNKYASLASRVLDDVTDEEKHAKNVNAYGKNAQAVVRQYLEGTGKLIPADEHKANLEKRARLSASLGMVQREIALLGAGDDTDSD